MTRNTKYETWLFELFKLLQATYAFFDKSAKEDEDIDNMQRYLWYNWLKKYSRDEILGCFKSVIIIFRQKWKDPTMVEYEQIILLRKKYSHVEIANAVLFLLKNNSEHLLEELENILKLNRKIKAEKEDEIRKHTLRIEKPLAERETERMRGKEWSQKILRFSEGKRD